MSIGILQLAWKSTGLNSAWVSVEPFGKITAAQQGDPRYFRWELCVEKESSETLESVMSGSQLPSLLAAQQAAEAAFETCMRSSPEYFTRPPDQK